jgi:hypothetical protein
MPSDDIKIAQRYFTALISLYPQETHSYVRDSAQSLSYPRISSGRVRRDSRPKMHPYPDRLCRF